MNVQAALVLDLPLAGKLAGKHLDQAHLDIQAAEHLTTLTRYPGKDTPEKTVCDFFTALWCNPRIEGYRYEKPLEPSAPVTGLSIRERTKREMLRWYALGTDYVPAPLSPGAVAECRRHVRLIQLSTADEGFQKLYASALGIPQDEVNDIKTRLESLPKKTNE